MLHHVISSEHRQAHTYLSAILPNHLHHLKYHPWHFSSSLEQLPESNQIVDKITSWMLVDWAVIHHNQWGVFVTTNL